MMGKSMKKHRQMKSTYSVARVSCCWPLNILFSTMNIGGINNQIIHFSNTGEKIEGRVYIKKSLSRRPLLMKPLQNKMYLVPNLALELKSSIKRIAKIEDVPSISTGVITEGLCTFCLKRSSKKV